jgi:outer membrane immunogenic protein
MRKLILSLLALVAVGLAPAFAETIKPPRKAAVAKPAPQPEDYVANIFADAPVAKLDWTGFYVGALLGYTSVEADGSGAKDWEAGGTVGFDWQVRNTALVLGARGSYVRTGFEGVDDNWSVDGRAGIAMGTALPYVFAGYGWTRSDVMDLTVGNLQYGVGVEWRLSNALSTSFVNPTLAFEFMRREFDEDKINGIEAVAHTGMARLNLRFGDGYKASR